jgi:hypothetical protein
MRFAIARRRAVRGQALVEFALVVPIFLFLLFGLIDGGRLVFANNTVSQAVREAVRLAHVQAPFIAAEDCSAPICPADTVAFRSNVLAAANRMTSVVGTIPDSNLEILCSEVPPAPAWTGNNDCAPPNNAAAGTVSVRIVVPIQPIIPLWGWFYPNRISADATMALP